MSTSGITIPAGPHDTGKRSELFSNHPQIVSWGSSLSNLRRYLLLAICGACLPAWAGQSNVVQSTPAQPALPASAAHAAAAPGGLIRLNVVVRDKAGKPVTGLEQGDFTLLEDKHPAQIAAFHAWDDPASAPPTQIVLAIDTVHPAYFEVQFERQAIEKFLREQNGHLAHPVWILWLTDVGVSVQAPPSTDGLMLATQVHNMPGIRRFIDRTAQWGPMERFQMSIVQLQQILSAEAGHPGRKLVIWIGPQWALFPRMTRQLTNTMQQRMFDEIVALTNQLRQEQITLDSVSQGLGNPVFYKDFLNPVKQPKDADLNPLTIEVLAVHSGGLVLQPSNDIQQELDTCAADAGPYYTLELAAPQGDAPDTYHDLAVEVDKHGLTARTVSGYFNNATANSQ